MVRLVVTDFASKEDYESFYSNINELETLSEIFVFENYKKSKAYLPRSEINQNIYSLNLISKRYLSSNNFLVYISDNEFFILFNHKTIYSAKINENFITDDMIKSILIAKHLTMLSSGGQIDKIYYLIDSKYRFAVENILKQNTKNEKDQVIAIELGHINTLVKKIPEMDTNVTFTKKASSLGSLVLVIFLVFNYAFPYIENNYFGDNYSNQYENDLNLEQRLNKRLMSNFDKKAKEYNDLTSCMTKSDGAKK